MSTYHCRLLALLRSTSRRAQDNRQLESPNFSGAERPAKELKIPIIVVAQVESTTRQRTGGKRVWSDLRESGSIEQDADLVGLLVSREIFRRRRRSARGKSVKPN